MKIQIELIIIFTIGLLFFFWAIWYRWTARRLKKKYNPDNDRSKKSGEERGSPEVRGTESNIPETISSPPGPTESPERTGIPTASSDVSGKNVHRFGNALRRTRRK